MNPAGVPPGFYVRRAPAVMVYHVASDVPELDAGVAWHSFGALWPTQTPVLSDRDAAPPPLSQLYSPFQFEPNVVAGHRS